jgi:acyl-CoA synthetase (NDP forming)
MILPEHQANTMLAEAGIPMIPMRRAGSPAEARAEASHLGYPVALKLSSVLHTHKTEIGGVLLNLVGDREVEDAFQGLHALRQRIDPEAVIIDEPMAPAGA